MTTSKQGVLTVNSRVARASTLAIFSSLALLSAAPAQAQSTGTRVALIDISAIFKQHPGFNQKMEGMKAEVTSYENSLRQRAQQIQQLQKQLGDYNANTPEYKNIESQILKLQANGQAEATLKKKEFLERESEIYFDTYQEIVQQVKRIADYNKVDLVLRYNSQPIDGTSRPGVLEGVNRAVVYNQANLDLTQPVLEQLIKNSAQARAPGAPTAPRR